MAGLTCVPGLLEALGGVYVGERLLKGLVIDTSETILVEVVADIDNEIDVHLLPDDPHLHVSVHSVINNHLKNMNLKT